MIPRGIRNNNPGNIRKSAINWKGETPGNDPDFETYATPEDGIRAMSRILLTYQHKHGLATVRQMIERWAPPCENDSDAYVAHVAETCMVHPDDPIDLESDPSMFVAFVATIIRHENGEQPYPLVVVEEGVRRALS